MSESAETDKLLPHSEEELRKSSSSRFQAASAGMSTQKGGLPSLKRKDSRFQVSLASGENGEESEGQNDPLRKTDNPDTNNAAKNLVERKMSATGRFTVSGPENGSAASMSVGTVDSGEETPDESHAHALKTVHFSVGDKPNVEEEEHRKSTDYVESQHTFNMKSWRNMKTLEHPPIIDFYRHSIDADAAINTRPSMSQLIHGGKAIPEEEMGIDEFKVHTDDILDGQVSNGKPPKLEKFTPPSNNTARTKFGWIEGVFVRCLLNIFGVMLYLRVAWVAGQAGILLGSSIVLLASVVTTITAISTCAICTNGDVKGGGAYFLISRSLGPEFGGSIGLIFSVANAVGAAMYVVGFAETVRDLMQEAARSSPGLEEFINDFGDMNIVRVVGIITCILLLGIVFIGTSFESKMQLGLLAILLASIVDYMLGTVIKEVDVDMQKKGITGYSYDTMMDNMFPSFRAENGGSMHNFFTVFSIYFPAATGIMAGANISGDLANPQKAIPLGTLTAIFSTTIVYLVTVWMTGSTCVKDADGINVPIFNESGLVMPNCTGPGFKNNECPYGLMNFSQVMELESWWGPLITAGIFAATLSSALASLVSAPKVFQAVCKDRLFPKIDVFAKGYGKDEEPRRAYALTGVIACAMILIGDLNVIAPIISNFFLASYALINYACFDQSFADSPGFRPGFKYYNMWVSLSGAILCICVMFIISWWTALLTFFFFAMLFLYILHRKPDVNWGSSTQAHSYKNALSGMVKLLNTEEHVKNYRPQLLVLTGNPAARPSLVDFVNNITKGTSLMMCGYVVPYAPCDRVYSVLRKLDRQLNDWLRKKKIKSFYASVANQSLRSGAQTLFQTTGLGKLRPNIVILGFKSNWAEKGPTPQKMDEMNDYFGVIQDAFECNMGVGVLRNSNMGLDFSESMRLLNVPCEHKKKEHVLAPNKDSLIEMHRRSSDLQSNIEMKDQLETGDTQKDGKEKDEETSSASSFVDNFPFDFDLDTSDDDAVTDDERESALGAEMDVEKGEKHNHNHTLKDLRNTLSLRRRGSRRATVEQKALLASISRFNRKVKRGVIDVWWLYDDGGLTLLIPHLLTIPKSYLEGARLRVFTISTSSRTMEAEQRSMAALLSKFRIDFSDVSVIADIGRKPRAETMNAFESLIEPFTAPDGEATQGMTTPSELSAQREKTFRQLRTAELLEEHSSQADLVVITLPVPRKGLVSASLYLAWLDMMTKKLPPTLLIRGNQQSVLTFYS